MGETRRSARYLDPYVLVTAGALAVALAQSVSIKTPAPPPSDVVRPAPAGRAVGTEAAPSPRKRLPAFAPYAGDGPFDPRGLSVWALVFGAEGDAGASPPSSGCGARATAQARGESIPPGPG